MPRIAFLQLGSFSHINEALVRELRPQFPEHELDVLDLGPVLRSPRTLARTAPGALIEHRGRALRSRGALRDALETGSATFAALSARASAHVRARTDTAFSLQTQSLFDAAVGGTPHFVYTDHTALANRHYEHVGQAPHFPARWLARERGIYDHAACTFVTGANVASSLRDDYGVPDGRREVVLAGIGVTPPAGVEHRSYAGRRLVFVGVDWQRKGGPELIAALDRLAGRHPDLSLTVVGCEPPVQRPYLRVVGRIPAAAVAEHLEQATAFVLPARLEPAGLAYAEAAAFGLPVVATATGGIPDRVHHEETGLLVPPGDVDALTQALDRVLGSEDLRRELGQAGRRLAAERFTWRAVTAAIADGIRARLTA
ncbi:MAG TPA: glycosyltransferase family 4 protein [Baekduia sp.]|nr:glycosyltransferase family 4 protein [Baekduia sp.]